MLTRGGEIEGTTRAQPSARLERLPRLLGAVSGQAAGPTVVLTGGLHGNEPAGVRAALEVLAQLGPLRHALRGRIVAFTGNRAALARGVRFLERDLNRGWDARAIGRLDRIPASALAEEDREQQELLDAFLALEHDLALETKLDRERAPELDGDSALERARRGTRLAFVDLHTTSGATRPFACLSVPNRRLASVLPIASVLGLERAIAGTMLSWCTSRGHVGLSVEAGQHDDPASSRRHVSAALLFLSAMGSLDPGREPRLDELLDAHRAALAREAHAGARVVEVRHRHVVLPSDEFEMVAGFESFDPIDAGQIVARDRRGPIRAPETGVILMPRYQGQGEDGFFVARDVDARADGRADGRDVRARDVDARGAAVRR